MENLKLNRVNKNIKKIKVGQVISFWDGVTVDNLSVVGVNEEKEFFMVINLTDIEQRNNHQLIYELSFEDVYDYTEKVWEDYYDYRK